MARQCPNCLNQSVNDGKCFVCGMNATSDLTANATNMVAFIENVQIRMRSVPAHQYQQIAGMYSPRPGFGQEDGIEFTEPECQLAHRYLVESNMPCIRIDATVKGNTLRTLIVAHNEEAIQKALRDARREINRLKGSIRIVRDVREYAS